jgi:protein gp37
VEDQKTADKRIPILLNTPAAVRFVSCEPLLGQVDFWKFATREETFGSMFDHRGSYGFYPGLPPEPIKYHEGIDWVIVGGESGPGARPMHPDWARYIRDQCVDAGVPFFFKQWGEWAPVNEVGDGWYCLTHCFGNEIRARIPNKSKIMENAWDGLTVAKVGKKRTGRLLDGREWNEFPEVV